MAVADAHLSCASHSFRPSFPYHIIWGVTNACGCRCHHCYSDAGQCATGELSTQEALTAIDQFSEAGILDIGLTGGEPLLRKDIHELIAYAVSRNMTVGMSSSGYLVTRTVAEKLRTNGLERLQISLDGIGESHDAFRGVPGLYRKALYALEAAAEAGLRRLVCFTATAANIEQFPRVLALLRELQVQTLNVSLFVPTGRGDTSLGLTPAQTHELYRFWKTHQDAGSSPQLVFHTGKMVLVEPALSRNESFIGCQAGVGTAYVDAVGNITPCVLLPVVLGNLRHSPFADIWQEAPLVLALRKRAVTGRCAGCAHVHICGGCRAAAYAASGDPLGEDPSCWLHFP